MASLFVIITRDAESSETLRLEHREGHLDHFRANSRNIAVAGPISGEISGSLVIYEAETVEAARQFIEGDPFHSAGVWQSIEVTMFKPGSGRWANA